MTTLTKYETARTALAECRTIDEVKDIHDKAEAMRVYARMAGDVQLEIDATEIRLRAERRLGQLETEMKAQGLLSRGGRPKKTGADDEPVLTVTLADLGISKKLSSRAQKVGGIADRAFDLMVENMRRRMGTERVRVSLDLLKGDDKKAQRATRERVLAGIQCALPTKKYGVIYADPEWRFEVYSRDTGMDRAADNHYPTSSVEEIARRPVADIAADDCVLFLWATVPMLQQAFYVMEAWGFARVQTPRVDALESMLLVAVEDYMEHEGLPAAETHWVNQARALLDEKVKGQYKSHCVWTKDKIGTGYWFRNSHELLLVGTRGNIPAPAMGTQWPSTIEARTGKHSAKPEKFYVLIEEYFPTLPKIELNARNARPGWDRWGNESGAETVVATTGEIVATSNRENALTPDELEASPEVIVSPVVSPRVAQSADAGRVD